VPAPPISSDETEGISNFHPTNRAAGSETRQFLRTGLLVQDLAKAAPPQGAKEITLFPFLEWLFCLLVCSLLPVMS